MKMKVMLAGFILAAIVVAGLCIYLFGADEPEMVKGVLI